jgi:hypothetical protein
VNGRSRQKGQAIALFALALAAIVAGVAVVVDGGYAFAQRRVAQNAADFAAMAGTRVVGLKRINQPVTAADVSAAIDAALAANDATLIDATYIREDGTAVGSVVGASSIPGNAFGVVVQARTSWRPFLLGSLGITNWEAGAQATAKTPGRSLGGGVMPVGLNDIHFNGLEKCEITDFDDCVGAHLTSGHLNRPGQFGWLKFGLDGHGGACQWTSSLGMVSDGGCQPNQPFLQSQIGPEPPADSHGCCTAVQPYGDPDSVDLIGGLEGNKVSGDLSFYIDNKIPVWVPIWNTAHGNGNNAYYHIVGFGALVFTHESGAKNLYGVPLTGACPDGTKIEPHEYCTAPGGPFILDATGAVSLTS